MIYICEPAILSILVSTIEAYPSKYLGKKKPKGTASEGEAIGLLFGQRFAKRGESRFNVEIAVPMQIVMKKDSESVSWNDRHFNRIRDTLTLFPNLDFLGTYHSHPFQEGESVQVKHAAASKDDVESAQQIWASWFEGMNENEEVRTGERLVELVVAINAQKHMISKEGKSEDYWLQGYCSTFRYIIAGYYSDDNGLTHCDRIVCPTARLNNTDFD